MPTDNVLVMINTAFNATGIKEAKAGFLGMNSALTASIAGLGLLVVASKSAMEIAEKHEKAENNLEQAVGAVNDQFGKTTATTVDVTKQSDALAAARRHLAEIEAGLPAKHKATTLELMHLQDAQTKVKVAQEALTKAQAAGLPVEHTQLIDLATYRKEIESFIDSNRAYISDQAEVINGYATLTRAGLSVKEVQLDMNRAVDLAALKNISLSDAVALVNNAEHGRLRGLVDLGITSKAYVDSSGNVVDANKNMAKVMVELDAKTAHGRDTTTQMSQATNRLSNDWQDIANNVGPPLLNMFDGILRGADFLIQKLKELGNNKDWNKALSAGFGVIQNQITQIIKGAQELIQAIQWIGDHLGTLNSASSAAGHIPGGGRYGRAIAGATGFEGVVSQPTWFLAGEGGQKEGVSITPGGMGGGGGGPTFHFHIGSFYSDGPGLDRLTMAIAQRLSYATGR